KTNSKIDETSNTDDELELAENDDDQSDIDENLKKTFTFRSSYLHSEINAYESSDGDPELFWHYLTENIQLLIHQYTQCPSEEEDNPIQQNELLDEIMQELQSKLDKSIDSNITLQALLDSLLSDGNLAAEQIKTIKNSQVDFHDLTQDISELGNKIQNSLNIEITKIPGAVNKSNTVDKAFNIEKTTNNVNTEVNKLKDIIYEQGSKINALLKDLADNPAIAENSDILEQFSALEKSQNETSMCIDVLEMENQRLMEELESIQTPSIDGINTADMNSEQLKLKIHELEKTIEEKDHEYTKLHKEFDSVQHEFLAVYDKDKEHN
ncbi:MAG: hypothetical protein KAU21_19700, partial [Gammaproteobacteria bacterium]|nr:hypothetical protein [Gammaproteobacteria bacterium]